MKPLSYQILYLQNQSHDSVFQPSENLHFENFSLGPTMVGPIVETGYERMFNALKVSNTTNDSHVCPPGLHNDRRQQLNSMFIAPCV